MLGNVHCFDISSYTTFVLFAFKTISYKFLGKYNKDTNSLSPVKNNMQKNIILLWFLKNLKFIVPNAYLFLFFWGLGDNTNKSFSASKDYCLSYSLLLSRHSLFQTWPVAWLISKYPKPKEVHFFQDDQYISFDSLIQTAKRKEMFSSSR